MNMAIYYRYKNATNIFFNAYKLYIGNKIKHM